MLSDLIVWYLFLGGMGAGAVFSLVILEMLSPYAGRPQEKRPASGESLSRPSVSRSVCYVPQPEYRSFFAPCFLAAFCAICFGMLCLVFDIGRIDRIDFLFTSPTPSFISIGVFCLTALILLVMVFVMLWSFGLKLLHRGIVRILEILCLIAAGIAILYTGLFLQSILAIALWVSVFVPILFILSSLSTGIALVTATTILTGRLGCYRETIRRLIKVDSIIIVIEICALLLFLGSSLENDSMNASMDILLRSDYASVFWIGIITFGLCVPFAMEIFAIRKQSSTVVLVAVTFVLLGGFCLRWAVVGAGMAPDVVSSMMPALIG